MTLTISRKTLADRYLNHTGAFLYCGLFNPEQHNKRG